MEFDELSNRAIGCAIKVWRCLALTGSCNSPLHAEPLVGFRTESGALTSSAIRPDFALAPLLIMYYQLKHGFSIDGKFPALRRRGEAGQSAF